MKDTNNSAIERRPRNRKKETETEREAERDGNKRRE